MTNGLTLLRPVAPKPQEFDLKKFSIDSICFRNEKDLNRKQLSELLNESENYIFAYENKGRQPSAQIFFNMCRLMNKQPEEYFK